MPSRVRGRVRVRGRGRVTGMRLVEDGLPVGRGLHVTREDRAADLVLP